MTQTLTTETLSKHALERILSFPGASHYEKCMAAELLANREAQPVVWVMMDDLTDKSIVSTPAYRSKEDAEERTIGQIAPLFTAPPAPAVPDISALTDLIVDRLIDCSAADDDSIADAETFVYNACRAAMLATAAPEVDHE